MTTYVCNEYCRHHLHAHWRVVVRGLLPAPEAGSCGRVLRCTAEAHPGLCLRPALQTPMQARRSKRIHLQSPSLDAFPSTTSGRRPSPSPSSGPAQAGGRATLPPMAPTCTLRILACFPARIACATAARGALTPWRGGSTQKYHLKVSVWYFVHS